MFTLGKDLQSINTQLVVCNFTPVVREAFKIGATIEGDWIEVFNSDDEKYGGGGIKNSVAISTNDSGWDGKEFSLSITVPPLATLIFEPA